MKSDEFCIWIKGYLQLSTEEFLTPRQVRIIYNHAKLVQVINKETDENIDKFISALLEAQKTNENIPYLIVLNLFSQVLGSV